MRIKLENTWLAAGGVEGPSGLSINGEQIVDDAAFFRAAARTFFARGGRHVSVQFSVSRVFDSLRATEVFLLTHFNTIPEDGLVECICGLTGDEQSVYLEDAAVKSVVIPSQIGTSIRIQYTLLGGRFTTDVPDEPLPSADPEEEEVSFRRGSPGIANGATQVDVTFSSPLTGAPTTVMPKVAHITGDDEIDCEILEDTITDSGFSVKLSAPTPNANYKLHYLAFL